MINKGCPLYTYSMINKGCPLYIYSMILSRGCPLYIYSIIPSKGCPLYIYSMICLNWRNDKMHTVGFFYCYVTFCPFRLIVYSCDLTSFVKFESCMFCWM